MKLKVKKRLLHRLKIIEGQIRGLQKMAEEDEYCIDIITQTQAAKEALSSVEDSMLENHLKTHVVAQMKSKKDRNRAIREILSVYKVSKKK